MQTTQYFFKNTGLRVVMHYPESYIIECYGYSADERKLFIHIRDSAIYCYENVSPVIYTQMHGSPKKGKFFLKEIRDFYTFSRIPATAYQIEDVELSARVSSPMALPAIHQFNINRPDCWL